MGHTQIPEQYRIPINYDDPGVPDSVRKLKPTLFFEGDSFCCLYGEDSQNGLFGCGDSPQAALEDWDKDFQKKGHKFNYGQR